MKKSNLPTWKKLSRRWRRKHKLAAKHPQPPCLASFSPSFLHITIPQAQAAAAYTQKAAPEISSHYYSGKSWPLRSNPFNMSEWKVPNANAIWSKKLSSQPLKREERRAEKACACSLSAPAIIIFAAEAAFSIIAGLEIIYHECNNNRRQNDGCNANESEREPANQIFVAKVRRESVREIFDYCTPELFDYYKQREKGAA